MKLAAKAFYLVYLFHCISVASHGVYGRQGAVVLCTHFTFGLIAITYRLWKEDR